MNLLSLLALEGREGRKSFPGPERQDGVCHAGGGKGEREGLERMAGQLGEAAKASWYQALNIRETGGKRTEKSMNGNAVLSLSMS